MRLTFHLSGMQSSGALVDEEYELEPIFSERDVVRYMFSLLRNVSLVAHYLNIGAYPNEHPSFTGHDASTCSGLCLASHGYDHR